MNRGLWMARGGCLALAAVIIEPLVSRSERYRRAGLFSSPARVWEIGNDEHEAIVAACEQGEAELAGELLARHFARSALTVLAKIDPALEPVALRAALQVARSDGAAD